MATNAYTGKAYGPFLELLTAVYEILDVDASAASQTAILRKRKSVPEKSKGI